MTKKQKLELTWIGKDERPKLEPRILIEDPEKSYHAKARREGDLFDNMLIHGDNLLALKALEQDYAGKVKCIYIDPPYNTGSAFEYYEDGLEHSIWLSLIRDRLEILKRLLSQDGSIWISIDDNEVAYLRLLCDEIFGRANFVASIIWEKRKSRENRRAFSFKHDYLISYANDKRSFESVRNPVPLTDDVKARYRNPDNDPRGDWQSVAITAQAGHGTKAQFYTIETPGGRKIDPPPGNCWRYSQSKLASLIADNRIYFGAGGNNVPRMKKFLSESKDAGLTPETIWYAEEVGTNDSAKRHSNSIFDGKGFDNPKPEELLSRLIAIATNPGDLVLDSFLGSGTTAAVAQKIGRPWIGIELGDHCETHCLPRMKKVVDGEDGGGVTEAVGWKGGGGFRYYRLAPSLLEQDSYGNWVIAKDYNSAMLAEAMCKHMGFTYAPSQDPEEYWRHGHSTETDFIFVTTASMTQGALAKLSEEVGPERTLLVCCKAFRGDVDKYENLTVVKIPQAVLSKCEWGRDDYSLNIANLPLAEDDDDEPTPSPKKRGRKKAADEPSLFGDNNGEG